MSLYGFCTVGRDGEGEAVKGYGLSKGIGLIIIEVKGEHSFYTPTLITV